jgi:integrase
MTAAAITSPETAARAEQGSEATASRHPQRVGPRDRDSAGEIVASLPLLPAWSSRPPGRNAQRLRGARRILDWLSGFPGDGWQARWLLSGADNGTGWIEEAAAGTRDIPAVRREVVTDGFAVLLLRQVVLPGYQLLGRYRTTSLFREARQVFSPRLFERIGQAGRKTGHSAVQQAVAEGCLLKMMLHTGRDLGELTEADLLGYHDWSRRTSGDVPLGLHAAWDLLRDAGVLTTQLPLRRAAGRGQLSASQLVDRYQLQCGPARDAFVAYLDERRPGLDYSSLQGLASRLAGTFWADIEQHHPGIGSLDLPAQVAEDWKQRLAFRTDRKGSQVPRTNRLGVLVSVRAFYLDIALWALEDPSWVRWAVPSPVRQRDLSGFAKEQKQVQARMHQRVRERLPRLPDLLDAAESHHADQKALLAAAEAAAIGQAFGHDGRRYRRISRDEDRAPRRLQYRQSMILAEDLDTGAQHDVTHSEDEAFWALAVIETLRHTGIRIEELQEITHLALVSYQLPDTGEVVPLLQIVPSKSNEERLLLVSPELAAVLATVISRLRGDNDGVIPLVARYDSCEHVTGPPLPHLFQRRVGWKHDVMNYKMLSRLIGGALTRAGITGQTGQPLRYLPHDFRRIFATDVVTGGLPVHIAARLLGHASVTTTEAYLAVFQDDLIRSYRAFLTGRRAARPEEEYREPTGTEWREFQQHFTERKAELGECARPYGTPCQHEHACVRCPMLRVSPRQRQRLAEIIRNLTERVAEARANGWLGEVQGLQVSLAKAKEKLASLDRTLDRSPGRPAGPTDLGMPIITNQR